MMLLRIPRFQHVGMHACIHLHRSRASDLPGYVTGGNNGNNENDVHACRSREGTIEMYRDPDVSRRTSWCLIMFVIKRLKILLYEAVCQEIRGIK